MGRRTYQQADKGEPYCIDWPEWHAECAAGGCGESTMLAALGEASTIRDAEARFRQMGTDGWLKRDGRWYCPAHAEE